MLASMPAGPASATGEHQTHGLAVLYSWSGPPMSNRGAATRWEAAWASIGSEALSRTPRLQ